MTTSSKNLFLVEIAIFSGLAILLDIISGALTGRFWPQGGSVSIGMLPILIMAFRWGLKGGLLTGFIFGLLDLIIAGSIYHPVQAFIDYFLAFTAVGFAGLFAAHVKSGIKEGKPGKWLTYIVIGTLLGGLLRFFFHWVSGIVFFGEYAPEGQPVAIYSLVYNGFYMVFSILFCIILLPVILKALPKKYFA
ncbi:energy-coupled thiamine transporter ThiT [Salirhabdus salicampi]|uniref:energy-coupled thiamine transporter ThiT n=1 Tax=Salirhabdus salicampi TaxID=476102 RepID=UPI0020C30F45|nr:energy-coupled thiamine transporter ThiT [Salirhabdus salicampi]MCP8618113.1 energy-coupled thiamine transporter ThiT [Salirhabdus salicampi]